MRRFNDIGFGALLLAISLLFGWILWPFFGAILWAVVVAIVFMPMNDRIAAAMPGRPTLAALLTLLAILLIVILPALAIGTSLVRQGADLYTAVQNGRIDLPDLIRRLFGSRTIDVRQIDTGPLPREHRRDGFSNTGRRTRNNRDFVLKTFCLAHQ